MGVGGRSLQIHGMMRLPYLHTSLPSEHIFPPCLCVDICQLEFGGGGQYRDCLMKTLLACTLPRMIFLAFLRGGVDKLPQ